MAERWLLFVSALEGALLFALLGALFGAVVGATYRIAGRSAGGWLGLGAADALARARGRQLNPVAEAALVGALDGGAFLGVIGTGLGLLAGWMGSDQAMLRTLVLGGSLLALGATFFGGLAYGLVKGGVRLIGLVFAGGLAGGTAGWWLAAVTGLFYGAATGSLAGSLAGLLCTTPAEPSPDDDVPPEP